MDLKSPREQLTLIIATRFIAKSQNKVPNESSGVYEKDRPKGLKKERTGKVPPKNQKPINKS